MGLNRTLTVRPGNFSGNSKVYSAGPEGLAAQIRNVQAIQASEIAIAAAVDDFVADNSGVDSVTVVTFDATGGTNEDQVTLVNAELGVPTGHPIQFGPAGADVALPLTVATDYFVIRLQGSGQAGTKDLHKFQVAESQLLAEQGVPIEFDDDGSGVTGVSFHLALPDKPVLFDGTPTNGVLDTQVAVTCDSIMEGLGSLMVELNTLRAVLGMEEPDDGTLTSATTVALMDVAATANTGADDAADYTSIVTVHNEMNNAIVTVALNINDVCAALGIDEYTDSLSPHLGVENAAGAIDAVTAATSAVGGVAETVELVEFNKALVVWGAAVGHLLSRVDTVSDAASTSASDYTTGLLPSATEVPVVLPGTRTRQR